MKIIVLDKVIKVILSNKILVLLTLVITLGVLVFDIFHYSSMYGIVEINHLHALFLVPFIALVCGLGIMLGTIKQQDDFQSAHERHFTLREKEVLSLVAQGKKNKEIAGVLFVDISTIKSHVNSIYKKSGVKSRKDLVALAKNIRNRD